MIKHLLRQKYPLPEWALIFELNKGVGFSGTDRRADAVAFNCYPSKGLCRYAFEFKTNRGDFIRELDNPQKRKWLEDNFHETYFVTSHGIAKEKEIPEGWGLLAVTAKGDSLRRSVIAKHREVPSLSENIALSAIRSLTAKLADLDLPYALAGKEVSKEDVEKWANQILDRKHKILKDTTNRYDKLVMELRETETALIEPFAILREALGNFNYFKRSELYKEPLTAITADIVREWLVDIANAQAKKLLVDAIKARDALSSMINKVQNENNNNSE